MPIPEGWAADADGVPTTDAREAVDGLILPMAGHKGYAISFMFDVLAGVLTGSSFGAEVAGPYDPERRSGCGHFLMVVDVAAMLPAEEFASRMEALVAQTKANPAAPGIDEIFVPGEIEQRNAARNAAGIAPAAKTWDDLSTLAAESGVAIAHLDRNGVLTVLALVVSLQVKPGHRDAFLVAIPENAERSFTDEPGCLYFDVTVDTTDDHHFVFYELYTDQAAIDAHRATPHFAAWRQATAEHVVPGSQVNTITEQLLHHFVDGPCARLGSGRRLQVGDVARHGEEREALGDPLRGFLP